MALTGVLAHPGVRARYHLRRATPKEIIFESLECYSIAGHARSFAESSAAKEMLPELVTLALEEGRRDELVFYRALVLEVARERESLTSETSAVVVRAMSSRDLTLRCAAARRLASDPRALSVVVERLGRLVALVATAISERRVDRDTNIEGKEILLSLAKFASANDELVGGRDPAGRVYLDEPWKGIVEWRQDARKSPTDVANPREPSLETVQKLKVWIEKNRSKLPEQIR